MSVFTLCSNELDFWIELVDRRSRRCASRESDHVTEWNKPIGCYLRRGFILIGRASKAALCRFSRFSGGPGGPGAGS